MDEKKRQRYLAISEKLADLVGGKKNIQGIAHCATRLRIVLENNDVVDLKAIEDLDLVKGVFVAGDQLQIIFGAGLVNDVYEVFREYTGKAGMSLSDLKTEANKKMNPLQRIIKALSDVFIDIMPGILAAALLTGLSGVLTNLDVVQNNATLYGITRLINISSGAIFGFLPLAVAYSACKRFGGRPILGIVVGCIMLSPSLADAYAAAQGTVEVTTLHIFGMGVDLVGFQGGIIVALLMGVVTAKLDIFFEKKVPEVVRLLVSPLLTTLVSAILLFTVVGPVGRGLASGLTGALVWMTQNLGVFGYAVFGGLQQLVVITGLHHIFGAIEAQLLADTGRNILNPLMSVAIIGQGGAVLGYLAGNYKDARTKELCIPSFISVLFGITEPALFGINLRFKYPLVGGCIGGALGGAIVYFTNLAALGFGTTVLPGIALADPANNGYVSYIIAHVAALAAGFVLTFLMGGFQKKPEAAESPKPDPVKTSSAPADQETAAETVCAHATGQMIPMEEVKDETFAQKMLGDGFAILPENGEVCSPVNGTVSSVFDTKHAVCLVSDGGLEILIHIGIDTVNLQGKYFTAHVKDGDTVKAGQPLVTFELDQVKKAGYDTVIPLVFTDPDHQINVSSLKMRRVTHGDRV
ncbi:MAG: PTS transporter subunit EIIC [Lachnospiraceae bacterium]|nr:PTS transporter subunit EIIC [Lachnospiraceae bacterium]